jgi:ribosomal protein S12 methylthiotransferase accessory factor
MSSSVSSEMQVRFGDGKRVIASYGGFEIVTDQSEKNGGDGSAPEPYDLFLASLATCAGVYVLGFCKNRDIPHEGVSISQRWSRDDKGKVVEIALEIEVPPDFPEKYRNALVRAASQCAVKKTIENAPAFVVRTISG